MLTILRAEGDKELLVLCVVVVVVVATPEVCKKVDCAENRVGVLELSVATARLTEDDWEVILVHTWFLSWKQFL